MQVNIKLWLETEDWTSTYCHESHTTKCHMGSQSHDEQAETRRPANTNSTYAKTHKVSMPQTQKTLQQSSQHYGQVPSTRPTIHSPHQPGITKAVLWTNKLWETRWIGNWCKSCVMISCSCSGKPLTTTIVKYNSIQAQYKPAHRLQQTRNQAPPPSQLTQWISSLRRARQQ